jgi:mono/diheme cytochrome c family protein
MIHKLSKSISHIINSFYLLIFLLVISLPSFAQSAEEGKKLFQANCTSCHKAPGKGKLVGPDVIGTQTRHSEAWLISWIKNSQGLVKSGDPEAVALFEANNKNLMTSFQQLSDNDVKSILAYIAAPGGGKPDTTTPPPPPPPDDVASGFYSTTTLITLGLLFAVLLLIAVVLIKIKSVMNGVIKAKYPEMVDPNEEPSFWETWPGRWKRMNKTLLVMGILFVLVLFGGYYGYIFGMDEVGVQQGYAPTQPIAFPHDVHAGTYKIDCKYCHSTVEKSKQASIPSLSTCVNCHKSGGVEGESETAAKEIQKVITAFETNTPVKWIRIHNLPDHAYFNHSQHVKVGKVECKSCHGEVEKMKVVSQQATLQMGWCIDCHNKSKVDVANNEYYTKLHSQLKAERRPFATVANNGGLECGKCHY